MATLKGSSPSASRRVRCTTMLTAGLNQVYVGVVDDHESLRRALARLVRAAGMQAVAYASAEAFCADMKRRRFACLVVDIHLPGMSGVDLRYQLAADGIATPAFFVTAHDGPRVRAETMAGPCAGYLHKTDAGSEILAATRRVLASPAPGPGQGSQA